MVKVTTLESGFLEVSGKTYDHKVTLKELGATWNSRKKCWVGIRHTPKNMLVLNGLKMRRRCGHCGEVGHFKPACPKYHTQKKVEIKRRVEMLQQKPPRNFRRFYLSGHCECTHEFRDYGYEDFVVMEPMVCNMCGIWCCSKAHPEEYGKEKNMWRFKCPIHGSSEYQMLNDTRGT
jgi:hypothetical protein